MMKCKVFVLQMAKDDIREARQWYNRQQAGLGLRLNQDMAATLRKIADNPTSFSVRYKKVRLAHFDQFPTPLTFT